MDLKNRIKLIIVEPIGGDSINKLKNAKAVAELIYND